MRVAFPTSLVSKAFGLIDRTFGNRVALSFAGASQMFGKPYGAAVCNQFIVGSLILRVGPSVNIKGLRACRKRGLWAACRNNPSAKQVRAHLRAANRTKFPILRALWAKSDAHHTRKIG